MIVDFDRDALHKTHPPGSSIPLKRIAACVECMVAFNGKEERACPKCGSDLGIARLRIVGIDIEAMRTAPEKTPPDGSQSGGNE